jgi:hypothetical protein
MLRASLGVADCGERPSIANGTAYRVSTTDSSAQQDLPRKDERRMDGQTDPGCIISYIRFARSSLFIYHSLLCARCSSK